MPATIAASACGSPIDCADASNWLAQAAAKRIADNAMQVLGGYGYTNEYKIERFLRDAKLNEIGGGTLESHQKNLTRDLTREKMKASKG